MIWLQPGLYSEQGIEKSNVTSGLLGSIIWLGSSEIWAQYSCIIFFPLFLDDSTDCNIPVLWVGLDSVRQRITDRIDDWWNWSGNDQASCPTVGISLHMQTSTCCLASLLPQGSMDLLQFLHYACTLRNIKWQQIPSLKKVS